jgi:hypothetical protein
VEIAATSFAPGLGVIAVLGIVLGLGLLARGMRGYRDSTRLVDTASSRISTLAAGEVRVSGVIEAAELTLVSPLQSAPCIYYDATIGDAGELVDLDLDPGFREQRAVGFSLRDGSGSIRVFPRGARWDAPTCFAESTGVLGDEPPGLSLRTGSAVAGAELDHDAAVAALLSVRPAPSPAGGGILTAIGAGSATGALGRSSAQRRSYREARLAPGDPVTIIGRALPFADLADPAEADVALGGDLAADDPEVAGDIAEAREAGLLADTPDDAWGNAAIPGFGIGRPARAPDIDPAARALPLATPDEAARSDRRFRIAPETLVLASSPGVPLLIAFGLAATAVSRGQDRFILGLLGAVLAIGSAVGLAVLIGGTAAP